MKFYRQSDRHLFIVLSKCVPTTDSFHNNNNMIYVYLQYDLQKAIDNVDTLTDDNLSTTQGSSSSGSSVDVSIDLDQPTRTKKKRRNRRKTKQQRNNNNNYKTRVSKATSTKPHDAPMKKGDIYFALDCEMVGVGTDSVDSALARVCIVNWDNKVVLDTFVKVPVPVTDYRTFVSGVRPEDIESDCAMPLDEVRILVQSIIHGKVLIGHGLENDLKALGISHPWTDIRDTAKYTPFMRYHLPTTSSSFDSDDHHPQHQGTMLLPRRLKELALEVLGKEIQVMGRSHCPIEDASASMKLYKYARNEWETLIMKQINVSNQAPSLYHQYPPNHHHPSYTSKTIYPFQSYPATPPPSQYYHSQYANNNRSLNFYGYVPRMMQV